MADKLDLNTTSQPKKNISVKNLQIAGEMFTYLMYCPPNRFHLMIREILNTESPRNIILALSSMMKTRYMAEKSLITVMNIFKLDMFKQIQLITKRKHDGVMYIGDGLCSR